MLKFSTAAFRSRSLSLSLSRSRSIACRQLTRSGRDQCRNASGKLVLLGEIYLSCVSMRVSQWQGYSIHFSVFWNRSVDETCHASEESMMRMSVKRVALDRRQLNSKDVISLRSSAIPAEARVFHVGFSLSISITFCLSRHSVTDLIPFWFLFTNDTFMDLCFFVYCRRKTDGKAAAAAFSLSSTSGSVGSLRIE